MLSRLRLAISTQLSRPSGRAGRFVARVMNRGNRGINDRAIELLEVTAGARVLDLGFGGALTFGPLLERGATVVGVDRAQDMVEAARLHHAEAIAGGSLAVHVGEVQALPIADASVDRALTVNTVYFWPDLAPAFAELHRVLVPGGRLVIGIRDGSVMRRVSTEIFTLRAPDDLVAALLAAGFAEASTHSAPDGASHLIAATR